MHRIAIAAVVAIALLPLSGCVEISISGANHEREETHELPFTPGQELVVETSNGRVKVKQGGGDEIQVKSRIRCETEERLLDSRPWFEERSDGSFHIAVAWADDKRKGSESCSFEILVPEVSGVRVTTSNGGIDLEGLGGAASFESWNGKIDVENHDGPVEVRTSNGGVTLDNVAGTIDAKTTNGRIRVKNAQGAVHVATSNGVVKIQLTDAAQGPVVAKSSNGRITLEVGRGFGGDLHLQTRNGRLKLEDLEGHSVISRSKREAHLRIGGGQAESRLKTSNGSIEVSSR